MKLSVGNWNYYLPIATSDCQLPIVGSWFRDVVCSMEARACSSIQSGLDPLQVFSMFEIPY